MREQGHRGGPVGVVFLIESLGSGGAERQLTELASRLDRARFSPQVIVWQPGDFFLPALEATAVPVHRVLRRGRLDLRPMMVARRMLKSGEARIAHGYLETGNFYAALGRKLAGRGVAITSERSQRRELDWPRRFHKRWSHRSSSITISNSRAGEAYVRELVAPSTLRTATIPNGIDMDRFSPVDEEKRRELRRRFGWADDELVFLTVGRINPAKNHLALVAALSLLPKDPRWRACWIGDGSGTYAATVRQRVAGSGLAERIEILPQTTDIESAYGACDIVVLPSVREGTPNTLLEAMACGRPAIATSVGDVGTYLDRDAGWLIPEGDVEVLGLGLLSALSSTADERRSMGGEGREKLGRLGMSVETMVRRHEALYERLLGHGTGL